MSFKNWNREVHHVSDASSDFGVVNDYVVRDPSHDFDLISSRRDGYLIRVLGIEIVLHTGRCLLGHRLDRSGGKVRLSGGDIRHANLGSDRLPSARVSQLASNNAGSLGVGALGIKRT